jgi:hypothetical protein
MQVPRRAKTGRKERLAVRESQILRGQISSAFAISEF